MNYCTNCGAALNEYDMTCPQCGAPVDSSGYPDPQNNYSQQGYSYTPARHRDDTMVTVVKIFLILGCISQGWAIIPLAWCIPITVSAFNKFKSGQPLGTGLKVCALLFVNMIAGICMLCMDD